MTFEQWMRDRLTNSALWPDQVDAVVERVKVAQENEAMAQRWNDDIKGYHPMTLNMFWCTVKRHALEYIDAECPEAWFRPLFAEEAKQ